MNLILVDENDFIDKDIVRLKDRRFEHIKNIHRVKVGDKLKAGIVNGSIGQGKVLEINQEFIDLCLELDSPVPKKLPVDLIIALPRPQTFKKVLEAVSALGVKNIHVIHSRRVEKSFWHSPVLKEENVRKHLILGLEQAGDTMLPKVTFYKGFKDFIEKDIASIVNNKRALVAHPYVKDNCPVAIDEPLVLAVGPEGGFIAHEIEMFEKNNFQIINCGARVLRVEHAVVALLSKLFI